MQHLSGFYKQLDQLESDREVVAALKDFFSEFGALGGVGKFLGLSESNKRKFLVQFRNSTDAITVTNLYRLRSFGFDGVLIELAASIKNRVD